jgi:hypothetical protein
MRMLDSKANNESVVDVAYVDVGLYFDITRFLEKHKDKISGDELTTLHIVSGAYLLKEDVKSRAILNALDIMARYEGANQAVSVSDFDPDDRALIESALANPAPDDPTALAIAERIKEAMGRYWRQAEKQGRVPTELILVRPKTALDDVACRLFLQVIADTLGHKLTIVWVDDLPCEPAQPVE